MMYVVTYSVQAPRTGRHLGGGTHRVDAPNEASALAFVSASVRASFGGRPSITLQAHEPYPQCPTCRHWHSQDGMPAACCGCKSFGV